MLQWCGCEIFGDLLQGGAEGELVPVEMVPSEAAVCWAETVKACGELKIISVSEVLQHEILTEWKLLVAICVSSCPLEPVRSLYPDGAASRLIAGRCQRQRAAAHRDAWAIAELLRKPTPFPQKVR